MRRSLVLMLLVLPLSLVAAERTWEGNYKVDSDVRFSLDSHKGQIKIRTANQDTITVFARIYFTEPTDEELFDYLEIRDTDSPSSVNINVEWNAPERKRGWSDLVNKGNTMPMVDFDIVLPDTASLRLESHKSTFDVHAPAGRIEVESHKGRGEILGVRSDLRLDSHKGDFRIEISSLNNLRLSTHKGNLRAEIHKASGFRLRADSHKGTFSFKGRDIPITHKKRGMEVSYKAGDAGHLIDLQTHKGHITLNFMN